MTYATEPTRRWTVKTETLLRGVLVLMLGLGSVSFIEPSPYEFFFFLLIPIALFSDIAITRSVLVFFIIVCIALIAEVAALSPYFEHRRVDDDLTPAIYTIYTLYLYSSAMLLAMIFSRQTVQRVTLALQAYAFSCVFAGGWGILSYLNVAGIGDNEPIIGRVAGPFKDPNVLGTYCILGTLYLMQSIIIGPPRFRLIKVAGCLISLFGGVFLSFSRGSWAAMVFAGVFFVVATYLTADSRMMRRRILTSVAGVFAIIVIATVVVASNDTLRETVTDRAKLEQDYDGGETGRFGNQKRSIPMMIERPLGFGPDRFPLYFHLAPHNSYIGAFASGGWIGGLAFFLLVGTTSFIAFRLAFLRSPCLRQAQVVAPALIGVFLQAFQIDVDHWRFVFLMLGAIWGMESARFQDALMSARAMVSLRTRRPLPSRETMFERE